MIPGWAQPMLASRGEVPLDSAAWTYEVKWDGMRALAGCGRLKSRAGTDCTSWYPELRCALDHLPPDSIFDGEIVRFVDGLPNFAALQRRIRSRGSRETQRLAVSEPVVLILFDVLRLDGGSMVGLPWHARREALEWAVPPAPELEIAPTQPDGAALWRAVSHLGLEGLIAKRRGSRYRPGERSAAWVKLKTTVEGVYRVGGWVESAGGGMAALMVGEPPAGGALAYRGHVAFGMTGADRERLAEALPRLERGECPFASRPPRGGSWAKGRELGPVHWVAPELVVRVRSYAGTGDGLLRDAVFGAMCPARVAGLGSVHLNDPQSTDGRL